MNEAQRERNQELQAEWDAKLTSLFASQVPVNKVWETPQEIVHVLQHIAGTGIHVFLPNNGGEDLIECRLNAQSHLEWTPSDSGLDKYASVVNPLRLTFWNPGKTTREANFVLETGALEPVGQPKDRAGDGVEEVTEIKPGTYSSRSVLEQDEYKGGPVPATARLLCRCTAPGRYAIFSCGSIYNQFSDTQFDAYTGYHNDPVAFAQAVEAMAKIDT